MVIVALVGWPAWRIASGLPRGVSGALTALVLWAAAIVGSAVIGKLGGITVVRWRHRRLRRVLDQAVAAAVGGR